MRSSARRTSSVGCWPIKRPGFGSRADSQHFEKQCGCVLQEAVASAAAALAALRAVNAALMARKQDTEWQLLAALARTGGGPPPPANTLHPDLQPLEGTPARGLAHPTLSPMHALGGLDEGLGEGLGGEARDGCNRVARGEAAASVSLVSPALQRVGSACAGCDTLQ